MTKTPSIDRAPIRAPRAPIARLFGPAARAINPLALRLAGSRYIPLWAIVRHRGRRSGKWYATPVAIAVSDGAAFVPLPFGSGAEWLRNVLTAGGCVIRWKGAEHEMVEPQIVDETTGRRAFNAIERPLLGALGIRGVLRMRFAGSPQAAHD